MRRLLGLLIAAIAWGAAPAPAGASTTIFFGPPARARNVTTTTIGLRVSGLITVAFVSDRASGCVHLGGCTYHGTQIFKPLDGQLEVQRYTTGGHRHARLWLLFNTNAPSQSATMFARVMRDGANTCADAGNSSPAITSARVSGGRFVTDLSGALAPTRCAGPWPSDLRAALPRVRGSLAPTRGSRIDARRTASFAGHGFAGTVTSTLVLTVGGAHTQKQSQSSGPPGVKVRRVRLVTEAMKVVGSSGSLVADVRGTSTAEVCVLLDSCGLTGTLTFTPRPGAGEGQMLLLAPATLPYRAFLVALGLGPGTPRRGLNPFGNVFWVEHGVLSADIDQGARCTDSVPLGAGGVAIQATRTQIRVMLVSELGGPGGLGTSRTRCAGPLITLSRPLASGSAPRTALRRRRFTVTLRARGVAEDDGYSVALRGAITLTFQAGRITSQFETAPVG